MVGYPKFELAGPPCETVGCTGVLTPSIKLHGQICDACSVCGAEFHTMPVKEKMAGAMRLFARALRNEKEN
jgi:hypothetical protein